MTYREKYPQVYKELDRIRNAPKPVFLTPDDIITLRLLRDDYAAWLFQHRRTSDRKYELTFETLERILKQVG